MILPTALRFLSFGGSSFPGITPCGFIPGYIPVTPLAFLLASTDLFTNNNKVSNFPVVFSLLGAF